MEWGRKRIWFRWKIIFEGEFKNGKRWRGFGKEFNSNNELIFEGEYNEGKRWNGKGKEYDKKNRIIYDGKYVDGLNEKRFGIWLF